MSDFLDFQIPENRSNVIKVIGTGGGGTNAINHMFRQGIQGVDFVICNTDVQSLETSPVPNKIQLGKTLTEGLGAGADPTVGEQAANESEDEIKNTLNGNTKMVFITAGMGGGTGTGSAPVIARICRELGILTVAIVTMPFKFEGATRMDQAKAGIDKLRKHVDSLIVINNDKLKDIYGDLTMSTAYSKADEILSTASRGIAEVITRHYHINIDLKDAATVLRDSGTAIMGSKLTHGDDRAQRAVEGALNSPLLNDNRITGAKNVLLLIVSSEDKEATMSEIELISNYIQDQSGSNVNIIMGAGTEPMEGEDTLSVTVIASGFPADQQHEITNQAPRRIVHSIGDERPATVNLTDRSVTRPAPQPVRRVVHKLTMDSDGNIQEIGNGKPAEPKQPKAEIQGMDLAMPAASTLPFPTPLETTPILDLETPTPAIEPVSVPVSEPVQRFTLSLDDVERDALSQKQDQAIQKTEVSAPGNSEVMPQPHYSNPSSNQIGFDLTDIEPQTAEASEKDETRVIASMNLDGEVKMHDDAAQEPVTADHFVPVTPQPVVSKKLEDLPVDYTAVPLVSQETTDTPQHFNIIDLDAAEPVRETVVPAAPVRREYLTLDMDETESVRKPLSEMEVSEAVELTSVNAETPSGNQRITMETYVDQKDDIAPLTTSTAPANHMGGETQPGNPLAAHSAGSPDLEQLRKAASKRRETLDRYNYKFKSVTPSEMESGPAYKRKGVTLNETHKENVSRLSVGKDSRGNTKLGDRNSWLHDNVD